MEWTSHLPIVGGGGVTLYVPECTIIVRDSDLHLCDLNRAAIMI